MKIVGKRYRILRELGSGGMATVYLAEDKVLNRQVAIKMIKTDAIPPNQLKNTRKRFQREEQHLVQLSDTPGIVNIYDVGEQRGVPFIVMSYMPGGSLRQHLGKPMPAQQAITKLLPVMNALELVHKQGIIHRDLKPSNILLDRYGNLAIADFGIAKALESEDTALTTPGLGIGTAAYMAPEQYHGETSEQSDVYALGVILYEMVTGAKPFSGATPSKIFEQQVQGVVIDPRKFSSDIPEELISILQKTLAYDRKNRYASVEALINDLTPWVLPEKLAVLNTSKGTPPNQDISTVLPNRLSSDQKMDTSSSVKTASQHKRSKKWLWIAVVGALLVLVVCIAGGIIGLKLWERDIDNQLANRESTTQHTATATHQPEEAQQTTPDDGSASEEEEEEGEEPAQEIQEETAEPNPTLAPTETPQPSSTPTLSPTATNTTTPTATLLPTPAAGEEEQIALGSGVSITQQNGSTGLDVYLYRADGSAITGKYVAVYTQKNDLSGNWVTDQRVCYGYTDNAGRVQCDLAAGRFIASAEFSGYNWGSASDTYGEADIEVTPGQRTQMVLRLGRLRIGFVYGDGRVADGKYVAAYTQRKNISDDWVTENRVGYGYTDNTGEMVFDLTPGNYMVACEFSGYNWGDAVGTMGEANIPVKPGETIQLVIHLSQLVVAVKDGDGNPVSNKYVGIHFQQSDANGNPTSGDRIGYAYTDNTGTVTFNVTPGIYAIQYNDIHYYNIELRARTKTTTDGINHTYTSH